MRTNFEDLGFSIKLRDIIQRIVRDQIEVERPKYRYATVQLIDRVNRKCDVILNGDTATVTVNMGSIQPSAVGQVVRVAGIGIDKFVDDVLGDAYVVPPSTTTTAVTEYVHTQSTPAASWVVNHNLGKQFPFVEIIVGGSQVYADITFTSTSQLTITFPSATSGQAHVI